MADTRQPYDRDTALAEIRRQLESGALGELEQPLTQISKSFAEFLAADLPGLPKEVIGDVTLCLAYENSHDVRGRA